LGTFGGHHFKNHEDQMFFFFSLTLMKTTS
jgi:hypothetical protein